MTEERFIPLAKSYQDTIFRVAYSYLKNSDDADDVTQDVLLQLYTSNTEFQSEAHVRNWLIRVAINRCKMLFRAPWRKHESLEEYAETLAFEAPEYCDLFTAVMGLDRKYRVPLYLYYYEGYSAPEIARLLHISQNTVSTRLRRARIKLKEHLTEAYSYD